MLGLSYSGGGGQCYGFLHLLRCHCGLPGDTSPGIQKLVSVLSSHDRMIRTSPVFKTCLYFQPFLIWYLVGILDCSLALWLCSFLPSSICLLSVCTVLSEELDDFTGPFSLCSSTCPPHLDVSVYSSFAFFSLNIFEQILSVFLWLT